MKVTYRINWYKVLRNCTVLLAITSLTLSTIQLINLGGF